MYSKIITSVNWGIEGQIVEIETKILRGLPYHVIVGLPSTIIRESKERVKAALKTSGVTFPEDRIIQNLFPANIKKEGSQLDLPIAMGIFCCLSDIEPESLRDIAFLGELSLDGKIQPVQGILSQIDGLKQQGIRRIVLPYGNVKEARFITGITFYPYRDLKQLFSDFMNRELNANDVLLKRNYEETMPEFNSDIDLSQVVGQNAAIRAIEIAVTGFHNILIIGPPGCGKSMLAERLTTIMPPMTLDEKIEVTKIYGISDGDTINGLMHLRPFRAPHHTISRIGLVGGGATILPGEISKAHNGILYLDEIGEFKSDAIEALREPLSCGHVNLTKGGRSLTFPSNFMMVATMNPCPCGHYLSKDTNCTCSHNDIKRYFGKLSWPILDRLDMTIYMERVDDLKKVFSPHNVLYDSARTRESISKAVTFKRQRLSVTKASVDLSKEAENLLIKYHERGKLSMRAYEKLVGISRTIADLDGSIQIMKHHILEAFTYQTSMQVKRFFE
jgi:magnesium chelatase family protein